MNFEQKAQEIIRTSIKSAIFIDEKARTFFQDSSDLKGENEELISVQLFNKFKEAGISLAIHQYKINDENDDILKNYLFQDRDLVLLDWNLAGDSGQEYSLKLLSDIIERPHIHFCTIYTSESGADIDSVFKNILSYFSNEIEENYNIFRESLELEEGIMEIKDALIDININRDSDDLGNKIGKLFKSKTKEIKKIKEITGRTDNLEAIIIASIALDNTLKCDKALKSPMITSFENKTIVIQNTIINILNKNENEPTVLIENISKDIVSSKSSFTQLLGLEMQSIFSESSAFIDENLLNFSKEGLIYHRENYKKDSIGHYFPEFIKEIMVEKAKLNIRSKSLSLLDDTFLDSLNKGIKPDIGELLSMNTFYNSSKLHNDNKLNFGDVFKVEGIDEYYICITALCDCLRPEKINNSFFFAKGNLMNKEKAVQLGDTAFLSYLNNETVVSWTDVISIDDDLHKFSPVYIKPLSFTVFNTKFNENQELSLSFIDGENGNIKSIQVKYITTVKANYTQRIANHAFSHPIRIGVDYVKSAPQELKGKALWADWKNKKIHEKLPKQIEDFKQLEKELIDKGLVNTKNAVFLVKPEPTDEVIKPSDKEKKRPNKAARKGS